MADETVDVGIIAAAASLDADIMVGLDAGSFDAAASLDIGFAGIVVEDCGFAATGALSCDMEVGLAAGTLTASLDLSGFPTPTVPVGPFTAVAALGEPDVAILRIVHPSSTFTCVLTGAADGESDLDLPINQAQCRFRSGSPTYMSVRVPGNSLADAINARANGQIVLRQHLSVAGTIYQTEELLRVDLEDITEAAGERSAEIQLVGHRTLTGGGQEVNISGVTYRRVSGGKVSLRTAGIDIFLRPGDTAVYGADSFLVDMISYTIKPGQATAEIME